MMVALLIVSAVLGGGIAAVAGFGIGSLITPVLALDLGIRLAVAVVALPHLVATAARFWFLRHRVDRGVFFRFGLASAVGGLLGAVMQALVAPASLLVLFGFLLVLAGTGSVTGWTFRLHLAGRWGVAVGALSGLLGGLVGNQGGIRSAALLGSDLRRESFVATATAAALVVDVARIPVYLVAQGGEILAEWPTAALLTAAVVAGTLLGWRLLLRIPEALFRRSVGTLVLLLGVFVLYRGIGG